MAAPSLPPGASGWVLYDNDCGICRWLAQRARGMLESRGLLLCPLQESWVAEELQLSSAQTIADFRLFLSTGEKFVGADVYRQIFKQIWWCWPIYSISVLPGGSQLFNFAYATFRDNRGRLSKACRL